MTTPASSVSRLRLLALGLAPALCVASAVQLLTHLTAPPALELVVLVMLVPIGVFQLVRSLALWLGAAATVAQVVLVLTGADSGDMGPLFAAPGFLLVAAIAEELGRQCVIAESDRLRVARLVEDLTPTDAVTGVTKWSHAQPTFTRELARSRRYKQSLALLMVTPKRWEHVCPRLGPATSKAVVAEVGAYLVAACRNVDIVAYRDGATFGLLLPDTPLAGAEVVARRIAAFACSNDAVHLHVGLAAATPETTSFDTLVREAETACSIAERLGRPWMSSRVLDEETANDAATASASIEGSATAGLIIPTLPTGRRSESDRSSDTSAVA